MNKLRLKDLEEMDKDYFTAREVGEVLGISAETVRTMVDVENFPIIKLGRNYRIPKEAFLRLMKGYSEK